jgi:glycerol kinase
LAQTRGEVQYFEPRLDEKDRDTLYRDWKRAVGRSRDWAV